MSDHTPGKIKYLKVSEYYAFARWIATPSMMRNPSTQGDFCVDHGVDPSTLSRWKNDPNFWEDVRRYEDDWARGYGADVKASIIANAIKGSPEAQKIYMTVYQGYSTKISKDTTETKTLETGPNLTAVLLARHKARQALADQNKLNGSGPDNSN